MPVTMATPILLVLLISRFFYRERLSTAAWIACVLGALLVALLAYASDGFLIATAMRPHEGGGQSLAHRTVSTTVLTQTISFHEPFAASDWLLLAHEAPFAGRGRSYGRANVFTTDGAMVASYVQDNMVRDFPAGQAPAAGQRSAH